MRINMACTPKVVKRSFWFILTVWSVFQSKNLKCQIVSVGNGSYTKTFPGVDVAGRNTFPSGTPFTIGNAALKPAPTNDWWSAKIKNAHCDNQFNYPYTLKTINQGLIVTYIPWGVIGDSKPIVVGVDGLNASEANICDFSDWSITMDWSNGNNHFKTTTGIGMPFLYFTKDSSNLAKIEVTTGTVTVAAEMLIIKDAANGADFAVYAPKGSSWIKNGSTYTSALNGKNYWSMAFIPLDANDVTQVANEYKQYAFVFPKNTSTSWRYDSANSKVLTNFTVETTIKEGTDTNMLLGLLPHHWDNLANGSSSPKQYSYSTVRGEMKTLRGNGFSTENAFYGVLPTLPYLDNYSEGFSPLELNKKISAIENDGLNPWTDSYNEGQMMNRLIQTARIADITGDTSALKKIIKTVKERLEDWLSYENGEVAFLFYYNSAWSALLGYPAGHGQDGNINDHHFHWGYFIHAASFMEQYEPGWAAKWGGMVNLLIKDAANTERNSLDYPFLRNFSPYAGHCWANGFASFPQGNDQESTSESMQFNSSLIHWGTVTGNKEIRDLGIYLYTTEQSAIEEYWLDVNERNFSPTQQYSLVSRVWGNSYDNGTFWTNDIAASYGIEMYPIHGGSLYLGQDTVYADKLWKEIEKNTGILTNEVNDNLWHDVMWEYLAFTNPKKAIELYNSNPNRNLKFGVSDAQTYHWLHAMNALGRVDVSVTSNYPLAAVFVKNGQKTYVVHNYGNDSLDVTFSDGYVFKAKPNSLSTSKDINVNGVLKTDFKETYPGNTLSLDFSLTHGTPDKVAFYNGSTLLSEKTVAPFNHKTNGLLPGKHYFYARVYQGELFNVTNVCEVLVGNQIPYSGNPLEISGSFESGNYDKFIAGIGQDIAYYDGTKSNEGDFRTEEYVDVKKDGSEGNYVGWILENEWLEYTVNIEKSGLYNLDLRFACGNTQGGGPFTLLLDQEPVASNIMVSSTSGWDKWSTKGVSNIPLKAGIHILRIAFSGGELNLGRLNFSYTGPLPYSQPVANAGKNILVLLPKTNYTLDGSLSSDPAGTTLSYTWSQIYGPNKLNIQNSNAAKPAISGLEQGVYLMQLEVDNGSRKDKDEVFVISNLDSNISPVVSICSPLNNASFQEEEAFLISVYAFSLLGDISKVEFYIDNTKIGESLSAPYQLNHSLEPGTYELTAKAYTSQGTNSTSAKVLLEVSKAPPCKGVSHNGDFEYEFSDDENNPTLTFIPSKPGIGSPTCILYYGTGTNAHPGYGVSPNVPYRLTAKKGDKIYFYYTYSYPGQGERNNAANKNSYMVGTCKAENLNINSIKPKIRAYPNPVLDVLNLELPKEAKSFELLDVNGKRIYSTEEIWRTMHHNVSALEPGFYFVKVKFANGNSTLKLIKR